MTRVIHTADTHLGYRQYHRPERRRDFARAFEAVVDAAVGAGGDGGVADGDAVGDDAGTDDADVGDGPVDAVVHAGDLFHDRRPGLVDLQTALDGLRRLDDAGVPFLAVVGNHEGQRDAQWVDLFEDLGLATRLGREPTVVGDAALYGLDYVPRSRRDGLDYEFAPPPPDARPVLVAHGLFEPFSGADWDTDRLLAESTVDFEALLLGDDHRPGRATVEDTLLTYAGSTERVSAAERAPRGYNVVEVAPPGRRVEAPVLPADAGGTAPDGSATTGTEGGTATAGTDGEAATTGTDGGTVTAGTDGEAATAGTDDGTVTAGTDGEAATAGTDGDEGPTLTGDGGIAVARRTIDTREFVFVDVELGEGEGEGRIREALRGRELSGAVVIVTVEAAGLGHGPDGGPDRGTGEPIAPASIEEFATDRGALVARVNDRRDLDVPEDDPSAVAFADPDAAVDRRLAEMGPSDLAREIDGLVRTAPEDLADANVREAVERRVREALPDGDAGAGADGDPAPDLSAFDPGDPDGDGDDSGGDEGGEEGAEEGADGSVAGAGDDGSVADDRSGDGAPGDTTAAAVEDAAPDGGRSDGTGPPDPDRDGPDDPDRDGPDDPDRDDPAGDDSAGTAAGDDGDGDEDDEGQRSIGEFA